MKVVAFPLDFVRKVFSLLLGFVRKVVVYCSLQLRCSSAVMVFGGPALAIDHQG